MRIKLNVEKDADNIYFFDRTTFTMFLGTSEDYKKTNGKYVVPKKDLKKIISNLGYRSKTLEGRMSRIKELLGDSDE